MIGNAIAFLVPIALYPLLSRVFQPNDYAVFGLYIAVFSFLEIASAGRYDFAIVMPEREDDAISLVAGGLIISFLYAMTILVLVFVFKDFLAMKLNNPDLANWLFLLPLSLFLVSVSKVCNSWLIRLKKFKASSVNKASQKIGEGTFQLTLGFFKLGNGLILGDIAGKFFNALFSLYQSVKYDLTFKKTNANSIRNNLKRYNEFPKFNILPSMFNALGGMLPVFVISAYYSQEVSGSFNFSKAILSVPFALISNSISQVLMQQISEQRHQNKSIRDNIRFLVIQLSTLSVAGIVVLYFWGPVLFEFVFGKPWRESGEFTQVLIFSYAVSFVVSPFSVVLILLGRIRLMSLWQISYLLAVSTLWFYRHLDIAQFLRVLVAIDIIAYAICGIVIYASVRRYENNLVQPV